MKQRIYSAADSDMLMAAATLVENAIAAQEFLVSKRPAWDGTFFTDLKTRVNKAFPEILGVNSYLELNETTNIVSALQTSLLSALSEFKVQVKVDYSASEAEQLFKRLGIGKGSPAYTKNQEALVESMQLFKTNLSPELKAELTAKGISQQLLDTIITTGDQFLQAELKQESLKASTPSITQSGITELNAIYTESIGIAKIAHNFYKGQPVEQAKFSFKKLISSQSGGHKTTTSK